MAFSPSSYAMAKKKFGSEGGGGGSKPVIKALTVTANGTYTPAVGTDGFSPVTVNVPEPVIPEPVIEPLSVTENGIYNPADGTDGFGTVTVAVPIPEPVVESLSVTENGTYTPANGVDGLNSVTVNVQASGGGDIDGLIDGLIDGTIAEITSSAESIKRDIFAYDRNLISANFPNAKSIGQKAFEECAKLKSIEFPCVETIGGSAFSGCRSLQSVKFPSLTTVEATQTFVGCSSLEIADLPMLQKMYGMTFYGCTELVALILRKTDAECTLAKADAFTNTPIASGTGYIYVPRAFLSDTDSNKDYRRATNWSTYAAQFRALEDYTVDGTTTGELDPTKI